MIEPTRILYEDNHLIAVNKNASELVQGDKTGDKTLADEVRDHIKKRDHKPGNVFLGVCHRLDRPTSGAVVFAKTGKALTRMNLLFRENAVSKTYWAVTAGVPAEPSGVLVGFLAKNGGQNKSYLVSKDNRNGKRAELAYLVIARSERYHLIEIKPETGRHHQIRVQLAAAGCPIKGDLKYGFPRSDPGGGIHLHARAIEFIHPVTGEALKLTAPVPEETLWRALEQKVLLAEL